MITTYNASVADKYRKLFREAEAVLSGYIPVKTYEADYVNDGNKYYYKDTDFKPFDDINNLTAFYQKLTEFQISDRIDKNIYKLVPEIQEFAKKNGYEEGQSITTLEEYYSWLYVLKQLGTITNITNVIGDYYWMKFIQLPIDEPHFVIDANTRSITIPNSFKSNGIGVQGDHMAEVVFFEINRFYDYMDLDQCEIYIQWEAPGSKTNEGMNVSEVCYKRAYVDTNEKTGEQSDKLVFAWAISDALTQNAGSLKFSVRFFKWKDGTDINSSVKSLEYSYSTLTATAKIQQSMNFNLSALTPDQVDDSCKLVGDRIGQTQLSGGYLANMPIFTLQLINDPAGADLNEEGDTILYAVAKVEDTGMLAYTWYKDSELISDENVVVVQPEEYLAITDLTNIEKFKNSEALYRCAIDADNTNTNNYTLNNGSAIYASEYNYYLKGGTSLKINPEDAIGVYTIHASNRTTGSIRYDEAKDNKTEFCGPQDPIIPEGQDLPEKYIINKNTGNLAITVKNQENDKSKHKFQWYKNEDASYQADLSDESFQEFESVGDELNPVEAGAGYYKVQVTSTRNNKSINNFSSNICRITNLPEQSTYKVGLDDTTVVINIEDLESGKAGPFEIEAIDLPEALSDGHIVKWYAFESTLAPIDGTEKEYSPGAKIDFNPLEYIDAIKSATKDDRDIIAKYYAGIRNVLNGEKSEEWISDKYFEIVKEFKPDSSLEEVTPIEPSEVEEEDPIVDEE